MNPESKKKSLHVRIAIIILLVLIVATFFVKNTYGNRAQTGDTVAVNYVGTLEDGRVFDTNIKDAATKAGILSKDRDYQPLVFQIGNKQVIPGFENAILRMRKGEEKTVTIKPEDAYGQPQENMIIKNRKKTFTRNENSYISSMDFASLFKKQPELNELLSTPLNPLKLQVTAITPTNITLKNLATVGQEIKLEDLSWFTKILSVENGIITFLQDPKLGDRIVVRLQQGNAVGHVSRVGADDFDIDLNSELAGKTLTFAITLVELKKP